MNINITSAKVFTPAQLAASPALTAKTQVNLTQAADGLQSLGTTGALTQGAKDIRVELADRTVVNLKFNVTADGATREDFLAALKQAVSEMSAADLSPSQLKVKKGLADTYRVLSGAPGIQLQNEDALAHKMQSLDQRFQRLMGAQNALSTSTTQDHRLKVVQGAKIKHSQGTDGVPFSEQRQHSLVKRFPQLAQHSLIKNYGLLMAKNQQLLSAQDGLRLAHPRSTTYLRDGHDAVDGLFREVMGKANLPQLVLPDQRFLVNADILEKLEILLGPANNNQSLYHKLFENPPTIEDVGSGLKVLNVRFRAGNLAEQDAFMGETNKLDALKHILNTIGATPSTYIAEAFMQPALAPLASNPALNNDAKVDDILASPAMAELGKLAEQHTGMGAMASASHNLIQGLFGRIPQNQNGNPLIDNALQQIEKLVEVMVASGEQPENFSKAFNFLIEELQIVLAEAKPYTPEHFEGGLSMVRYERLPVLADVPPEGITVGYASSGMDALSTAFAAAKSMHGAQVNQVIQGGDNLNYFEVPELLKGGQLGNANEPIITAALNPSTPQASVNIQELAAKVNRRIEDHNPTTLILDVTIESDKTKLNDLMTALKPKIDDGSLNVILCKSYQKYGSLGSAKIMAGSITMINNGDAKFNDAKQFMTDSCDRLGNLAVDGTGKMIKGESQFLTHLIRCTHPDEIELIKDAAQKAQFIDRFVWPPSSDRPLDSSVASLPFVVRSDAVGTSAAGRLKVVGIEERDSFSFLNTSFLKISPPGSPVFLRLNPGHESPTRMVEQFFAVGHLSSQEGGYPNLVTPALISKKLSMIDLLAMGDVQPHIQALNGVAAHTLQTGTAAQIEAALGVLGPAPGPELCKFIDVYVGSRGSLGPAANRPLPDAIVETALRDLRGGKTELMNKVDFLALPNAGDHLQALVGLQNQTLTAGSADDIILAANAGANPAFSDFIRSFVAVRGAEALTPAQVYAKTALELRKEPVLRLNQVDLLAIPGRTQHLVALANVQQDLLEAGSVAQILAALDPPPSDQMVTFVHKFVEIRGGAQATPQQIVDQALLDINTVHPDFCHRANFLSFANPMPQIEALAHLNDMALLTTGSAVEIGQRIVENTQTRMAFLALPEQAQRLLDLGPVPEDTLKTGSVQQIEQALGAPVAVIPDVLHTFITQFVAVRGDREKTPQEVIAECNHQVQAVYPGTQIVSGNPIPDPLVVNADLTSFVTLFTTARGAKQENPMKILQDSKMLFRGDQVMPKAEFLDNLRQYQSSMKASLVHLLRTTGNLATAPAKAAVQTAYEKIIAQDFRGDGPDSESISPQTRATIMKDWASFALPALQPTVLEYQRRFDKTHELLQMHVDDMPAYQRLNALESMDNRVFATPHPGGTGAPLADQQKLVKVLIEGAQAHEVFGLLQDLILKDPAQPDKTQALLTAIRDLGADLPNGGGLLEGPVVSVPGLTAKAQLLLDPHAQTHLGSIAAQLENLLANPLITLSEENLNQGTADVIIGAMDAPSDELQAFVRNYVTARDAQHTSLDEIRLSTFPQAATHIQNVSNVDVQILKRGNADAIVAALGMPLPVPDPTTFIQTYVRVRDSFDYTDLINQQLQGLPDAQNHLQSLNLLPNWNLATNAQTADNIIAALGNAPAPSAELQNFVRDYVQIRNQTIESPADLRQHLLTY